MADSRCSNARHSREGGNLVGDWSSCRRLACTPASAGVTVRRKTVRTKLGIAMAALAAAAGTAWAQTYPAGPMRIVVPFAPGGSTDIMARTVAQQLTGRFRQQVLVENRPGASRTIGTALVATSPPDGHTMMLVQSSFGSNPRLFKDTPSN